MAQAHSPEKVLTKNIRRVRDLEDKILCPRTMAMYVFLQYIFFSDIFFLKCYVTKRRTKRLK